MPRGLQVLLKVNRRDLNQWSSWLFCLTLIHEPTVVSLGIYFYAIGHYNFCSLPGYVFLCRWSLLLLLLARVYILFMLLVYFSFCSTKAMRLITNHIEKLEANNFCNEQNLPHDIEQRFWCMAKPGLYL